MSFKQVVYFGADGSSGYANAAKGYMYSLLQQGVDVYFVPVSGATTKNNTEFAKYFHSNLRKLPLFGRSEKLKDAEIVVHITPNMWGKIFENYSDLFGDRKIIGRTVWDFDPLPEKWVKAINDSIVNIVSVPSQWTKEVFIKSGVKKEIVVDPHTVPSIPYESINLIDTLNCAKIFSPVAVNYRRFEKRIKFLNVTTLAGRKNTSFLIDNYLSTFEFDDETLLVLKLTDNKFNLKGFDKTIQNLIVNKIKNKHANFAYAPIALITDALSFDRMQSLYDNCDVYVNVSRGEGFSIPCYTAKEKNKGIITPLHGGMVDYLTGYKKLYEVDYSVIKITDNIVTDAVCDPRTKGIDPSYDDLSNAFKAAYYDSIRSSVYFTHLDSYQPHTDLTEESSLFPIYFKTGWHQENLSSGVWSNGTSELIVGGEVYKLEMLIESMKDCDLKFTVDGTVHNFELKRGQYSIKIIGKHTKNIQFQTDVFSGDLINRAPTSLYGIKIVDLFVNGIRNNTSKLILKDRNFEADVLNETGFIVEKSNVLTKGEYGDVVLKFKETVALQKYPKKLNLGRQLSFYSHRSGWNYVLNEMSALNSDNGVYCDGFLENNFSWRKNESVLQKLIPYNKSWVGFLHNPPNMSPWFSDNSAFCNIILHDPYFLDSLRKCKGLFTLSEYHARFIRQYLPFVQVESLLHPTEIPAVQFDFDKFASNPNKKLISIGWWLRKLNALYTVQPQGYQKIRLLPNNKCKETIMRLEKIEEVVNNQTVSIEQRNSVQVLDFLPNEEYDQILSENLVYLDLYDSSANNGIIECIARGTPLFINRLPAVEEYLGESYPLYIENQNDLEQKIQNLELIRSAHLYLKTIRYKVEIEYFLESLVNSKIYKSL